MRRDIEVLDEWASELVLQGGLAGLELCMGSDLASVEPCDQLCQLFGVAVVGGTPRPVSIATV